MSGGFPGMDFANWTRSRPQAHPFAEWCFCDACARGVKWRAIAWAAFTLIMVGAAIALAVWGPK